MVKMEVTITIEYKRSSAWGHTPHAHVQASVIDNHDRVIAQDTSTDYASGCGYDKTSAAICYAFNKNNILQTLALWSGFNPTKYTHLRNYGYSYSFDGCGVRALTDLMSPSARRERIETGGALYVVSLSVVSLRKEGED
jgi:hypothetical protein